MRGTSTGGVPVTSTSATSMTHPPCVKSDQRRDVLNSRLSHHGEQNCIYLSETLLRCTWSRHMLNAEHSRPLIVRLLRTSWEGRRLSSRHSADEVELLRLLQTPTFAAVVVESTTERPRSSGTDVALLYYYNTTLSLTCRWLVGYENVRSSPTCRWLRGSVNPSSSTLCRWRPGSDHVPPSSIHPRRHGLMTPRRDPSLRLLPRRRRRAVNDDRLVPTPTAS